MILRDAQVFDGYEFGDGPVRISDGRITGVGAAVEERDDADERAVSLPGRTILPGLVDAHVHFSLSGERSVEEVVGMSDAELALVEARNARTTLESGVTAVRVMGARDVDPAVVRAVRRGDVRGPRAVASARSITVTGGHGHHLGREIDGPTDARRAVREQVKQGADFVKFMTTGGVTTPGSSPDAVAMTEDEVRAIVDEAHRRGVHAATHAHGAEGVKLAARAGVDTVEHGTFLDDEAIDLLVEHGTTLVPTLSAPHHIVRNLAAATDEDGQKTERIYERHLDSFARAVEAGVEVAGGTDAGTPFNYHGANPSEVEFMIRHAMAPVEALRAMTSVAAEAVGLDGSGTLDPGTHADLVVVDGDPRTDPRTLNEPEAVIKGGELVAGTLPRSDGTKPRARPQADDD